MGHETGASKAVTWVGRGLHGKVQGEILERKARGERQGKIPFFMVAEKEEEKVV